MTTTLASPTTTVLTTENSERRFAPSGLVAGIGGLAFVGTVLVQNALRARFPANDAPAGEVMRYYANHRGTTLVLAALFAVGSIGIVTFLGGAVARAVRGSSRGLAIAGAVGGAAIFAMFSVMVALDISIAGYVHRGAPDASVVEGLWVLHNSVFGVLLAAHRRHARQPRRRLCAVRAVSPQLECSGRRRWSPAPRQRSDDPRHRRRQPDDVHRCARLRRVDRVRRHHVGEDAAQPNHRLNGKRV